MMPNDTGILFAHGAGAGSNSSWMKEWKDYLSTIVDSVQTFDYSYLTNHKPPPKAETLVPEHLDRYHSYRTTLTSSKATASPSVFLAGKSMGSRVSLHVADALTSSSVNTMVPSTSGNRNLSDSTVKGCVCFGYPLVGMNGKVRDEILRSIGSKVPVLFITGTDDKLCPLDHLRSILRSIPHIHPSTTIHTVQGGDHSLIVRKKDLKVQNTTQENINRRIIEAIKQFIHTTNGKTDSGSSRQSKPRIAEPKKLSGSFSESVSSKPSTTVKSNSTKPSTSQTTRKRKRDPSKEETVPVTTVVATTQRNSSQRNDNSETTIQISKRKRISKGKK